MMGRTNARPLLIMTCATRSSPGESHASLPVYYHSSRRPRLRRATVPAAHPLGGPRPHVQGVGPVAVLFWAASRISSLAAACASLRQAPSDSAAHDALVATLPAYAELQRRLNRGLSADLPKGLRKRRQ